MFLPRQRVPTEQAMTKLAQLSSHLTFTKLGGWVWLHGNNAQCGVACACCPAWWQLISCSLCKTL